MPGNHDANRKKRPLKRLPVNESSFSEIIGSKSVYVDKTRMIHSLITNLKTPYFLARPRRFGKTLVLDTIQNVFEGRQELFAGLDISKLKYDWKPYPVIRLDLSSVNTDPDEFQEDLTTVIKTVALRDHKIHLDVKADSDVSAIRGLIEELYCRYADNGPSSGGAGRKSADSRIVVILIDEYDAPMLDNIDDYKKCEAIRQILYKFYRAIKSEAKLLRHVFVTGITKFKKMPLFSALNNIKDISLGGEYSTLCGFTQDELTQCFDYHLNSSLKSLKRDRYFGPDSTVDTLMTEIMYWYDGYSFDGRTTVFNPYSIVSFFDAKEFDDYWYQSGDSLFNHNNGLSNKNCFDLFDTDLSFASTFKVLDPGKMNDVSVLMQTGYLTIDRVRKSGGLRNYHLKIPNNEIRNAIAYEIMEHAIVPDGINDPVKFLSVYFHDFIEAFLSMDGEKCESLFSSFIAAFPSNLLGTPEAGEYVYHALLYCQLKACRLDVRCENRTGKGISDIVVRTPAGDWIVIELKYTKPERDLPEYPAVSADPADPMAPGSPDSNMVGISSDGLPHISGPDIQGTDASVPPDDSSKPLVAGLLSEPALKSLRRNVDFAFKQIVRNNYALPFISMRNKVFAVAVAVYGRNDVMFRFKEVAWSNETHKAVAYK
ncbi:MAG: ATP-binding protein [Deltaproteobacteria bacterium]|nr:ATP-binding protein [Deltaproteobacteria bacterium]